MNPKKQNKYMSPYYFLFYIQWAYVESPKYKMICLKSPKSSEIAVFLNKQWSKNLNYVYFIMF